MAPAEKYIHHVIKELTDRPGDVVYRDDIEEATGLDPRKISSAIRRAQVGRMGSTIETVVYGRAWRYKPTSMTRRKSTSPAATTTTSQELKTATAVDGVPRPPLTQQLSACFRALPNQELSIEYLTNALGIPPKRIKSGIANMKMSDRNMRDNLETTKAGKMWRYNTDAAPLPTQTPTQTPTPLTPPSPVTTTDNGHAPVAAATAVVAAAVVDDAGLLLLEPVGRPTADGALVCRDGNGKLFRVVAL